MFGEGHANDEGNVAAADAPYLTTISLLHVLGSIQMFGFLRCTLWVPAEPNCKSKQYKSGCTASPEVGEGSIGGT